MVEVEYRLRLDRLSSVFFPVFEARRQELSTKTQIDHLGQISNKKFSSLFEILRAEAELRS